MLAVKQLDFVSTGLSQAGSNTGHSSPASAGGRETGPPEVADPVSRRQHQLGGDASAIPNEQRQWDLSAI